MTKFTNAYGFASDVGMSAPFRRGYIHGLAFDCGYAEYDLITWLNLVIDGVLDLEGGCLDYDHWMNDEARRRVLDPCESGWR